MGQGLELGFVRPRAVPCAGEAPSSARGHGAARQARAGPGALGGRGGRAVAFGALAVAARLGPHGRRRRRSPLGRVQVNATPDGTQGTIGGLSVAEVERRWEEAESLGRSSEDIAKTCALLCCVQKELGYFAALHEGAVGSGRVVGKAPSLPMVLTWEGPGGLDDTYGMCLGQSNGHTLLHQLLNCVKQTQQDKRWGRVGLDTANLRAKVSLLRGFEDISESPLDWTPGVHGLWYSTEQEGSPVSRVFLPEVAERVAGSDPDPTESEAAEGEQGDEGEEQTAIASKPLFEGRSLERVLRSLATQYQVVAEDDEGGDEYEEDEEDEERDTVDLPGGALPAGSKLFRFQSLRGECPLSNLPTMKTRTVSRENMERLLIAQARLDVKKREEMFRVPFAALTTSGDAANPGRVCAYVVPELGDYAMLAETFKQGLTEDDSGVRTAGIQQVRRIFVIASVWDCYIDGCGLPERRCAWYNNIPLDLVVIDKLRKSGLFTELMVEQDMQERAIEVLLPLVGGCLEEGKDFTLVPVYVGGLMSERAGDLAKLLAPYLVDPANVFIVAGSADAIGQADADPSAGPPWANSVPALVKKQDQVLPTFDALELFLSIVAQAPDGEKLSLKSRW